MTESTDSTTNSDRSDFDKNDYPINRLPVSIHQNEHINDDFGLFVDDDDDDEEYNLTLLDLKSIPKSDHDLSIFDELAHQCDEVLHSTQHEHKKVVSIRNNNNNNNNTYSSTLLTTPTMMDDYERRFQRSLHKLPIPSWYNESTILPTTSTKPSIISSSQHRPESIRTPEIVHIQRPHSYRSYHSSLGTSPSPSVHSWHPNNRIDGMNFSSLLPSSSSTSRRYNKYEKGIDRVTKSSHWYRPTQFVAKKKNDQIDGNSNVSIADNEKCVSNHYDVPKTYVDDDDDNNKLNLSSNRSLISRLSLQRQSNCLIDDIDFHDGENTCINEQNNKNDKGNIMMTYDKQQDNDTKSNEIQLMPLANEKALFGRVELEDVTDEDENDKRSSTNNIQISSTVEGHNDDNRTNTSIERLAENLVDSILNDVLVSKNLEQCDNNDINIGVRELSDDENGLRELDENDMSGTDEFIVFATKPETSDADEDNPNTDYNQISSTNTRGSLNRLYTFSRSNDDGTNNLSKKLSSNQDFSTSNLMIVDKDILITNTDSNQSLSTIIDNNTTTNNNDAYPTYRSHIQKRHINLGRYYDGMMRGQTSLLPTHDLRCNLRLNSPPIQPAPPEGITEETVRKGRILLDSIPNSDQLQTPLKENVLNESIPVRPILKNTRVTVTDEINDQKMDDYILKIEEKEHVSPRKIVTTITEEYHRIQRKIIEQYFDDLNDTKQISPELISSYKDEQVNNQQSLIPAVSVNDQSPYELLSECYSGYSFIRNHLLLPPPRPPPLRSNLSSLQTTTADEAYESEVTTLLSPQSPTMSSSTITTTAAYVHPDLEHEFEYPSPPPPVPDRRLKPAHLRPPPPSIPPPPPTKPRSQKQNESNIYSKIQKKSQTSPLVAIRHLLASTPDQSPSSSTRTLSSRHFCGTLPISNEPVTSSSSAAANNKDNSKKFRHSSASTTTNTNNEQQPQSFNRKSSSTSSNKTRTKKSSSAYFDEATNGLPIRLPVTISNGYESTNKQNLNRISTPSTTSKRTDGITRNRPISENLNLDRSSAYETSV